LLTFDGHIDTLMYMLHSGKSLADADGHVSLDKLCRGRVSAQIFAVFVEPAFYQGMALHRGLEMVDLFWRMLEEYPEVLVYAGSGSEIREIHQAGKIACLLGVEGGEVLQGSLAHLRTLHRLGVRVLTLTWNYRNALANGQAEGSACGGLSPFGRDVVREMNRLRMLIDISHLNEPGFWEVLELSEAPVIASHSCARALRDHPRNLTDEQIRALAEKGGVIGVNFCPSFLTDRDVADLDDVLDHIEHFIAVGGEDCVGLGSDFDGIDATPTGLDNCSVLPAIAQGLAQRGFSSELIDKVMGQNFLRIAQRVLG
jgi:membrane dipeptidase